MAGFDPLNHLRQRDRLYPGISDLCAVGQVL